ncbi:hypothetical protein ES703_92011 [subsurface metagenome]
MPSLVTTMAAPGLVVVATEKPTAKKKITSLIIDNVAGGAARRVDVRDSFIPSITNLNPAPGMGVQNPLRFSVTIPNGAGMVWNFDETELRNVEVLGALELIIDNPDAGTIVTIAWEHV